VKQCSFALSNVAAAMNVACSKDIGCMWMEPSTINLSTDMSMRNLSVSAALGPLKPTQGSRHGEKEEEKNEMRDDDDGRRKRK